ncbi:MAG: DUF448 domain-containing protein [Dehalococcoidia bacterium]|nr:DUF448 domain-containing protein [Dehalococcoidia bacterium]
MSKEKLRIEPQRTCLGCHSSANKSDLFRLQWVDGEVGFTSSQKGVDGRSAYLHKNSVCMQRARDTGIIEKGLRLTSASNTENFLTKQIENLEVIATKVG